MAQMPKPQVDMEPLMDIIMGAERFRTLAAAMRNGIFTLCQEPKSAGEISDELDLEPKWTQKLLNALAVMELLTKKGDKYQNSPLASTFLVRGKPFYQGDYIKLEDTGYNVWQSWEQALKEGIIPSVPYEKKTTEVLEEVVDPTFTLAMANFAMRGGVHRVVEAVEDLEEFKKAKKLLELGCGTGIYSIALAQSNPHLKVVAFDVPPVLKITKSFIAQYGMEQRFETKGGDYRQDDLGGGYDAAFASHTFYGYPKEILLSLLKRIHGALNDGGIMISNHYCLNEDGTGHKVTVFWDIWLTLLGYPITTFTQGEYIELFTQSGFSILRARDISIPTYPGTVIIGKKEV